MADLIGHPWMMEAIPSKEEIMKEFAMRSQKVKERAEAEAEQEKSKKSSQQDPIRRNIVINDKIYTSGDLSEQDLKNP